MLELLGSIGARPRQARTADSSRNSPCRTAAPFAGTTDTRKLRITKVESVGVPSAPLRKIHQVADRVPLNAVFCCLAEFASPSTSMRRLVGAVGVEPTTNGLKGRCSATELRPCGIGLVYLSVFAVSRFAMGNSGAMDHGHLQLKLSSL